MTVPTDRFYARVEFRDFIRHFRKLDDAAIAADVKQSMDDIDNLNDEGSSFGSLMVKWSLARKERYPKATENGRKGGRPRKQQNLEVLVKSTLPGTASGDAAAVTNNAVTAPAGQLIEGGSLPSEGACLTPVACLRGATGHSLEARTTNAATTPVPVPAHGNAAGGLRNLGSLVGPETGETFERADAGNRKDPDASTTVRAQTLDGDAATREGAVDCLTPQGERSESATSPSHIQKRPGKSATISYDVENSMTTGGSERGADGFPHAVRLSPGAKNAEITPIGIMGNVRVTPEELGRYRAKYGDPSRLIDALSAYVAKTGRRYKSHFAALVSWARRDIERGIDPETGSKADQLSRIRFAAREAGIDAFSGKRIDFATGEIIEPASGNFPEIPYNPHKFGEAE